MRIIGAINVLDGKSVRLNKGSYNDVMVFDEAPLDIAKRFEDMGVRYLHLIDLDGAKGIEVVNWKILEQICDETELEVDFGGGLKTKADIVLAMDCGAEKVNIGSAAIEDKDLFCSMIEDFGSEHIILAADVRDGKLASNGWHDQANENVFDSIKYFADNGLEYLFAADISRHGQSGPPVNLYKPINEHFPNLKLIAKGGITSPDDLNLLEEVHVDGVIVGRALYENKIPIDVLESHAF